jgi:hypothetical protein
LSRLRRSRIARVGALAALAAGVTVAAWAAGPRAGSAPHRVIIGTNDAAGWGPRPARRIRSAHIVWDRVNVLRSGYTPLVGISLRDHFHVLGIVGNLNDDAPLSSVEPQQWSERVVRQLRINRGITIAEAGNEMYLKASRPEPVQYGRMYLAGVNAMRAAGINIPLLFNMEGDYERPGTATWSLDSAGGGWLGDAVKAVPGLAAAILANGIAVHPYGELASNSHDTYGVRAVAADERVARRELGATPPLYITEFGYNLAACGTSAGACSPTEQATKLQAAYAQFLADPHVAGIWWYQSHPDSTGDWGYMNSDNTVRPSFAALARIAGRQAG